MSKKILILDNSIVPTVYTPVRHWAPYLDAPFEAVRMQDLAIPDLEGVTHVIITGSEASITSEEGWIDHLAAIARRLAIRRTPVLASCFGHQLLARALAGIDHVRRSPTPEFGWVRVSMSPDAGADPVAGALPSEFYTYSAHFDEVYPLPSSFALLGASSRCSHAVIRHRELPWWGFQHHPEITPSEGRQLIAAIQAMMPEKADAVANGLFEEVRDDNTIGAIVSAFLRV